VASDLPRDSTFIIGLLLDIRDDTRTILALLGEEEDDGEEDDGRS
jgi:hypothetical protein